MTNCVYQPKIAYLGFEKRIRKPATNFVLVGSMKNCHG
jgi:hypothetical protein